MEQLSTELLTESYYKAKELKLRSLKKNHIFMHNQFPEDTDSSPLA